MVPAHDTSLCKRLSQVLPQSTRFTFHHVVATPSHCPELFPAAPGQSPEPTQCQSQFLSVSIRHEGQLVQVFAIEILVYTTETLTTLFVSKADSTGYLYLLNIPKGLPSPIRSVITVFLEHLIETKWRGDRRLVLSLFARAQDQYLFPGSIENSKKHVLDDRALIRWWSKIFDAVLLRCPPNHSPVHRGTTPTEAAVRVRGHIVVPGCDSYETKNFVPRSTGATAKAPWNATDPLRSIGKPAGVPERCLIPRFPDDPQARFALDLDDELPDPSSQAATGVTTDRQSGKWRSVQSLEQFWELMSFRQECAAGRLVGFLWAVFEPAELADQPYEARVRPLSFQDAVDKLGEVADMENVSSSASHIDMPSHASVNTIQLDHKTSVLPTVSLADYQAQGGLLNGSRGLTMQASFKGGIDNAQHSVVAKHDPSPSLFTSHQESATRTPPVKVLDGPKVELPTSQSAENNEESHRAPRSNFDFQPSSKPDVKPYLPQSPTLDLCQGLQPNEKPFSAQGQLSTPVESAASVFVPAAPSMAQTATASTPRTTPKPFEPAEGIKARPMDPLPETVVLNAAAYTKVMDQLLKLDYDILDNAVSSTRRFVESISQEAGLESCGYEVIGEKEPEVKITLTESSKPGSTANVLGAGLIRKKKRAADAEQMDAEKNELANSGELVHNLTPDLVRKKPKT